MNGHHIYIKDGKILAGSVPGASGVKKATKSHLAAHQATLDAESKKGAGKNVKKTNPKAKPAGAVVSAVKQPVPAASSTRAKTAKDHKPASGAKQPKLTISSEPSEETVQSTRKFKPDDYKKWFTSLPTAEQRKVLAMKDVPKSKYTVSIGFTEASNKDAQRVLDAFHYLRAKSGLSKTKAGTETSKKGIKDTRHQAQENRTVAYDVGSKVGGARKDLASISQRFEADPTAQDLESLEKDFPESAQKLCTKKVLLKPLDWEAERNNGVDVNTAMAKKLVYDRIATEPAKNTPLDRMLYFNAMRNIQRILEPIKTFDEFRAATSELGKYMRRENPKELGYAEFGLQNATKELNDAKPSNYSLTQYGASFDRDKNEWVIPKDAMSKWRAAQVKRVADTLAELEVTKKVVAAPLGLPLGEKFHNFFTDYESRNNTYKTIQNKRLTWDKYFEDKANKTSEGGNREQEIRPGEERARIPLGQAKRVGGRKSAVAKPEDMVKNFNFRGVEFGNYVNDADGKHHLVKASEAFQDLADVLGLKDKDVSLNGRLAMSFGARGKGGALAHYESVSKVINMTRDAGAGTLAHEWGHALDNILHAESVGSASIGFASDKIGTEGSGAIRGAYQGLMDAIEKGDGKEYVKPDGKNYNTPYSWKDLHTKPFAEALSHVKKNAEDNYRRQIDHIERYMRNPAELRTGIMKAKAAYDKDVLNKYHALASHFKKNGKAVPDFERDTGKSHFLSEADRLCKGKQGYWNRKHELFARSFEAYVLDKLGSSKRQNDYLVAGTNDPRTYPQGKERELINQRYDALMEAVRTTGAIQKGLDLQKALFSAEELRKKADEVLSGETQRFAYQISHTVDTSEVLYIPVNRLNMVYQTDAATDWDKVKENMNRMQAGEALEPVVIGFDYDVHDGHHRWLAARTLDHTHVPCVVGGTNELQKTAALEKYRELWKAMELEGGAWRTMNGHHVYIKGGKIVAGGQPWMHGKSSKEVSDTHKDTEEGAGNDGKGREAGVKGQAGSGGQGSGSASEGASGGGQDAGGSGRLSKQLVIGGKKADIVGSYPSHDGNGYDFHEIKGADAFHSAITDAKEGNSHGAFVHAYDKDEYEGKRLFVSPGGEAGFALTDDGDIVSVFRNPKKDDGTKKGVATEMLLIALKNGGKKLDCFDGFLPRLYAKLGFEPVSKVPFDKEYAPEGWNYERDKEPDVVFMAHNGDSYETVEEKIRGTDHVYPELDKDAVKKMDYADDYDDAVAKRDDKLQKPKEDSKTQDDEHAGIGNVPAKYHDAIKEYLSEHKDDAKGILDGNMSKGRCDTVSSAIVDKLKEKGIHARLAEGQGLKTGLDEGAHSDWKDFAKDPKDLKFMGHTVIQTPDGYIDVTGSQFGKKYGGIRFVSNDDFKKEWASGKVNYTKNQRDDADMDTSDRFSKLTPMKAPKKLQKAIIIDPVAGTLADDPNIMYRGIGLKELIAINASGFVQTKGKGNDGDKGKRTTCFTNLFEQAEGYARTQYSQYGEKAAYVIALPKPPWIYEDEHGELLSDQPVPFGIGVVIPIEDPASEHYATVSPSPGVELLVKHNYL